MASNTFYHQSTLHFSHAFHSQDHFIFRRKISHRLPREEKNVRLSYLYAKYEATARWVLARFNTKNYERDETANVAHY